MSLNKFTNLDDKKEWLNINANTIKATTFEYDNGFKPNQGVMSLYDSSGRVLEGVLEKIILDTQSTNVLFTDFSYVPGASYELVAEGNYTYNAGALNIKVNLTKDGVNPGTIVRFVNLVPPVGLVGAWRLHSVFTFNETQSDSLQGINNTSEFSWYSSSTDSRTLHNNSISEFVNIEASKDITFAGEWSSPGNTLNVYTFQVRQIF